MTLYVKDEKMPKCCADCEFYEQSLKRGDTCYAAGLKHKGYFDNQRRASICPLRPLSEAKLEEISVLKRHGGGYFINEDDLRVEECEVIWKGHSNFYACSKCNYMTTWGFDMTTDLPYNYCPNCGRKIKRSEK
jgi:DNA-directed RNA polymerase subunit RPC12/RpoP